MGEVVRGRRGTGRDGDVTVEAIAWPDGTFSVRQVEEKAIAPLLNGTCHSCGEPCRFVFVSWCDRCMGDALGWCDATGRNLAGYCRVVLHHAHS